MFSCVCIIIAFKCVVLGPTDKYYKWSRFHHIWSVISRSFSFVWAAEPTRVWSTDRQKLVQFFVWASGDSSVLPIHPQRIDAGRNEFGLRFRAVFFFLSMWTSEHSRVWSRDRQDSRHPDLLEP